MTNNAQSAPHRGSLLVIFLTVFIDLLGFGMVLPLLPIYAEEFGLKDQGLWIGMLMSCFSLMQFLFAPLWGRLSDSIGRRPVLLVGLAGSTVFYSLFGVAAAMLSLPLLFATRIGAGIAGATISTAQAYIADSTPLEGRTKGMALIGAAFGLGFTFGPLLGAAALWGPGPISASPWPGYLAGALSGVALLLAIFLLPESRRLEHADASAWHRFSLEALVEALRTPSVGELLATSFISVVAFGGFESTLSLLLKSEQHGFGFDLKNVLYVFAFIGLVLSVVQGGIVRRLSGRVAEHRLALVGGVFTIAGFAVLQIAARGTSVPLLFLAATIEVSGFAFITPSLQSLISRRSDPEKQGGIMGVSQSVSALARIAAPMIALPLRSADSTLPYSVSIVLMGLGMLLLFVANRRGKDFGS
jgi:MFS family permease